MRPSTFAVRILSYFILLQTRGRCILKQLSKPRFFYRVRKSRAFLRCYAACSEEKGAIFKPRKKRGFESCSNISFPLVVYYSISFVPCIKVRF